MNQHNDRLKTIITKSIQETEYEDDTELSESIEILFLNLNIHKNVYNRLSLEENFKIKIKNLNEKGIKEPKKIIEQLFTSDIQKELTFRTDSFFSSHYSKEKKTIDEWFYIVNL